MARIDADQCAGQNLMENELWEISLRTMGLDSEISF